MTYDEFAKGFRQSQPDASDDQIFAIFYTLDKDYSKTLSFLEFQELFGGELKPKT
jgi:hypothetical protein